MRFAREEMAKMKTMARWPDQLWGTVVSVDAGVAQMQIATGQIISAEVVGDWRNISLNDKMKIIFVDGDCQKAQVVTCHGGSPVDLPAAVAILGWLTINGPFDASRADEVDGSDPPELTDPPSSVDYKVLFTGGADEYLFGNENFSPILRVMDADGNELFSVDVTTPHTDYTGPNATNARCRFYALGHAWYDILDGIDADAFRLAAYDPATGDENEDLRLDLVVPGDISANVSNGNILGVVLSSDGTEVISGYWMPEVSPSDDLVKLRIAKTDAAGTQEESVNDVIAYGRDADAGFSGIRSRGQPEMHRLGSVFVVGGISNSQSNTGNIVVRAYNDDLDQQWQLGEGEAVWDEDNEQYIGGVQRQIPISGTGSDGQPYALLAMRQMQLVLVGELGGFDWEAGETAGIITLKSAVGFPDVPVFQASQEVADVTSLLGNYLATTEIFAINAGPGGPAASFQFASLSEAGAVANVQNIGEEINPPVTRNYIGGETGSVSSAEWDHGDPPVSIAIPDISKIFNLYEHGASPDLDELMDESESRNGYNTFYTAGSSALTHLVVCGTAKNGGVETDSHFVTVVPYGHFPEISGAWFSVVASTDWHAAQEEGGSAVDIFSPPAILNVNNGTPGPTETPGLGDYILVNDQTRPGGGGVSANGIYEVTGVGPPVWTKATLDGIGMQIGSLISEISPSMHKVYQLTSDVDGPRTVDPGTAVGNEGLFVTWDDMLDDAYLDNTILGSTGRGTAVLGVLEIAGTVGTLKLGGSHIAPQSGISVGDSIVYQVLQMPGETGEYSDYASVNDVQRIEFPYNGVIADGKIFTYYQNPGDPSYEVRGVRARNWPALTHLWDKALTISTFAAALPLPQGQMAFHRGVLYVATVDPHSVYGLNPDTGDVVSGPLSLSGTFTANLVAAGGHLYSGAQKIS